MEGGTLPGMLSQSGGVFSALAWVGSGPSSAREQLAFSVRIQCWGFLHVPGPWPLSQTEACPCWDGWSSVPRGCPWRCWSVLLATHGRQPQSVPALSPGLLWVPHRAGRVVLRAAEVAPFWGSEWRWTFLRSPAPSLVQGDGSGVLQS